MLKYYAINYMSLFPHGKCAASQCNTVITQKTSSSTDMFYIYAENKLRYRHTSVNVHYTFVLSQKTGSSHLYSQRRSSYVHKISEERRNSKAPDINFSFFFIFTLVCFTRAKHSVVHMYIFICFLKLLVL